MAKTANQHVLDVLNAARQPVTLASLGKQLSLKGVKYATTSKATQQLVKRNEIVLVRRGLYAAPGFADREVAPEESPTVSPSPALTPALGVAYRAGATVDNGVADPQQELLDALEGEPLTFDELLEATGWARAALLPRLREASEALRIHCAPRGNEQVYFLAGQREAPAETEDAPLAEPAPRHEATAPGADHREALAIAAPRRSDTAAAPHALTERLSVISQDLEDALGDACDAQMPHALIKALVVANGAAHRAARLLGA